MGVKMPPATTTTPARLEQRLVLLAWLHQRLGYKDTAELLEDAKLAPEGYDPDGRSYVCLRLIGHSRPDDGVSEDDLKRYDDNIRAHLAAMNAGRAQPITLRYFQYLAALYAEIFLDAYFSSAPKLLKSLNDLIRRRNISPASHGRETPYAESDLTKLAFWMATGSGKTLIMHLNYYQFLYYNDRAGKPLDGILLITPNEGLTEQHLRDFAESNIPSARLDPNRANPTLDEPGFVRVTEITKLVMEKRGEGESVSVDTFEGNNLVFVDEGHKGSGGDAWREIRDALAETGFTFEYSATFGQALSAARNDALSAEYGKAIAFDYSYRHFYRDGHGKDFRILNLSRGDTAEQTDRLLLANTLSFYEQQLAYENRRDELRPYNLDRPLWVFVGGSVNAVYSRNRRQTSDVLTVARFLNRALLDPGWAIGVIGELLDGNSGLIGDGGQDLFADRFGYLSGLGQDAAALYRDILRRTFHATTAGGLRIADVRGHDGELGLKVSGSEDYFGLIYIGDTARFKNLVMNDDSGIVVEDDAITADSLFSEIADPDTKIEMLVGSRKFSEGWNSWRVSNMGLLNMGRSEGSQIIQLFGRGVRLRGLDFSLKRSSAIGGDHPEQLDLLETLNIFSVRADYMDDFRNYLEREGIPTGTARQISLFIKPNRDFLKNKGLVIPRLDEGRDFAAEAQVWLEPDTSVRKVFVDASTRVQSIDAGERGIDRAEAATGGMRTIPAKSLALIDWRTARLALAEHAEEKGMVNLSFDADAIERVMLANPPVYTLRADGEVVEPRSFEDVERLQAVVLNILRKYADALYRHRRQAWESQRMAYRDLDANDPNFTFNAAANRAIADGRGKYAISVPSNNTRLIEQIERLIADCRKIYGTEGGDPPRIHFDRHLYQPLLLDERPELEISPPALNASERQFTTDLRTYWRANRDGAMSDSEIFLLRNQGRGTGVGFFDNSGFYPDFILWIKTGDVQRIIFVEPHGMIHANAYIHDEKARLHERLPEIARRISRRSARGGVSLDSYIVSATPYDDLYKRFDNGTWTRADFARRHILFSERDRPDGYDYIAELLG